MFKSLVKRWMMLTDIKDNFQLNTSSLFTYWYPKGYLYKWPLKLTPHSFNMMPMDQKKLGYEGYFMRNVNQKDRYRLYVKNAIYRSCIMAL